MNGKLYSTMFSAMLLAACGGGGGDGSSPASVVKLDPTAYDVYKTGQEARLSGAVGRWRGEQLNVVAWRSR